MTAFGSNTVNLAGLNLIEASAGTGKTYTLAELYLRLILEKGLTVDQILVVTYTKAATEELRDRLRQRLVDARDTLLGIIDAGKVVEYIQKHIDDSQKEQASRQLNLAIQSFDEAAILTIHGFCQRVLGDFAFESALPFELELMGDDVALLQSATDDFWRREVMTADRESVAYLVSKKETPETLLKSIRNYIGKPYLNLLAVPEMDVVACGASAQTQFERVQSLWQQEQEAITTTLQNKTLLNGRKYPTTSIEKWLGLLTALLVEVQVPLVLFADFERFTPAKLEDAIKPDQTLPELRFWSACETLLERCEQRQLAMERGQQQLRLRLLTYLRTTLPDQKQQQQVQSYDDLLLNLDNALKGEQGEWLAEQLRAQYPAALIDEFQDTDPIQYASFSRIYTNSGLPTFLVGDPKQAIYSFRGADIFTYLEAKSAADKQHTLATNWRSHPKLVSAVNTLFERQMSPFHHDDIPFQAVAAAREALPTFVLEDKPVVPLQVLWAKGKLKETGKDKGKAQLSKGQMTEVAVNATANEIATLLNQSALGKAHLCDGKSEEKQSLVGGDIAVLVRNHKQALAIQYALQVRGINSVQQGKETIFAAREAQQLERILWAIAQPANAGRVRAALVTELWGITATQLYALEQDDIQWQSTLDVFYELHQQWQQQGFTRMFRQWLIRLSVQQRVLTLPNGERILTNLNHLAELIQAQCSEQKSGMEAVLHWLAASRQSDHANNDAAQLRLESDEQLVKIITIHKSKGLEYPIVFCPFLWDVHLRAAKNDVISFHGEADQTACVAFSEPDLTAAQPIATAEERAEDMRLLYVALTRAKEQCVIVWGPAQYQKGRHVSDSALFSLLHPTLDTVDNDAMRADLEALVADNRDTISITPIMLDEQINYKGAEESSPTLTARQFKGNIAVPWAIGSFSGLTRSSSHPQQVELPDYDQHIPMMESLSVPDVQDERNRFSFPRGAQAGTCLHALFEYWDFTSDDSVAMKALVARTLLQYGFDAEKWTDVACQWLVEVLATPLDKSGFKLADLTPIKRLDELEFYFPVADLTVSRLQQALLPILEKDAPLAMVLNRLNFHNLDGFMKGFIDLVYEHEGRFYVVDYKSNHLGNKAADYQAEALEQAMISHGYPLQYAIYSLALHRYLRLRIPDYDPAHHFGGVYYLFIRGMHPERGQDTLRPGVFFDKPSEAILDALDGCMRGDN